MAVPAGPTEKRYIGNGVTTIFTIPFLLLQPEDLDVYIDGVLMTAGYTLSGVGNPTSTITFASAPAALSSILLQLDVPFERLNDYQENGDFLASTVNRDFDRLWQALKQLMRLSDRSLRLGNFDVDGAGQYRAKGNGIVNLASSNRVGTSAPNWNDVADYVAEILATGQGPLNNAANVFYLGPHGSINTLQDLSSISDPYKGSALIGRQPLQINNVAELRQTAGRFEGDVAIVKNYLLSDGKGAHCPADWIVVALPAVPPADDGGMIIRVAGVSNAYWRRRLNSRGMVDGEVYGLPMAAGQDAHDKLEAVATYCAATKISCFLGKGPLDKGMFVSSPEYDTFERSMPFSGPRVPGFSLVNFGYEIWSEPGAVFQTTSANGSDVFNLCCMENFGIRGFPTIRGFLTAFTGSGSNAVSMVFGVRNIIIEAHVENMPTIWLPGGGTDGGHGYTIQIGAGTVNPVENITFRGTVKGCTTGVNVDGSMTDSISRPYSNIHIDNVIAEGCYYGFGSTGTTPTASIANPRVPQPCMSISGRMKIKNCQRAVFAGRLVGGDLQFEVYNDKEKADLIRNPNSTSVYVAEILGTKHMKMSINARTLSLDFVVDCGGVGMGGNAFPSIEHCNIDIAVRYTTATTEFTAGLAATPPLRNSTVRLNGFVAVPDAFAAASLNSDVYLNGSRVTPTLYPGDETVQAPGGSTSAVIYTGTLTGARSVVAPPSANRGDQLTIIRTSTSGGAGSLTGPDGSNVATNSRSSLVFNGAAWARVP